MTLFGTACSLRRGAAISVISCQHLEVTSFRVYGSDVVLGFFVYGSDVIWSPLSFRVIPFRFARVTLFGTACSLRRGAAISVISCQHYSHLVLPCQHYRGCFVVVVSGVCARGVKCPGVTVPGALAEWDRWRLTGMDGTDFWMRAMMRITT